MRTVLLALLLAAACGDDIVAPGPFGGFPDDDLPPPPPGDDACVPAEAALPEGGGCRLEWACPEGAFQLSCTETSTHAPGSRFECECRVDGVAQGAFDALDVCAAPPEDQARAADRGCSWFLARSGQT